MKHFATSTLQRLKRAKIFINFVNLSSIQLSNAALQIILVLIVTRIVGISEFGYITVFSSYAALAGLFINYGTSQSGIKDIAVSRDHPERMSESFFTVLIVRFFLFLLYILFNVILIALHVPHVIYFTLAGSIVLAEAINPLFFFIGIENLTLYNFLNILAKFVTILLILLFVKSAQQAPLVNFFVGATNFMIYLILVIIAIKRYKIIYHPPTLPIINQYLKNNSYLLGNNLSVQLQQSFFLFVLAATGNSLALGAYSLGDKVVWSCRLLLMSMSNAVFPKGALIHSESNENWKQYKKRLTLITGSIFLAGSLLLLIFPGIVIKVLTGTEDPLSIWYLRSMSFAPFLASLNVFNVLDLLYKNDNRLIFFIAVIILIVSVISTIALVAFGAQTLYGFYLPTMDLVALLLYTYFINKYYRNTEMPFNVPAK